MADPTRVVAAIRDFADLLENYGHLVLAWIERVIAFLAALVGQLPGWATQAWAFLLQLLDLVRAFLHL